MKNSFYFIHQGQRVLSEIIFNFNAIHDIILVLPLTLIVDVDTYILFAKKQERKWLEETQLSIRFPETFKDMAKRLAEYFIKDNFSFHPNAAQSSHFASGR